MLVSLMNNQLDLLKKELEELRKTNRIILDVLTPSQTDLLEEKIHKEIMAANVNAVNDFVINFGEIPEKLPSDRILNKDKRNTGSISRTPKTNENADKEKLIEKLVKENTKLRAEVNDNGKNGMGGHDIEKKIQFLNAYEEKLKQLFDELLEASEVMQESREKFCKCLKEETEIIRINNEKAIGKLKQKNSYLERELEVSQRQLKKLKSFYYKMKEKDETMISERKTLHKLIRHLSKLVKENKSSSSMREKNLSNKDIERKNFNVSERSHVVDDEINEGDDCVCYSHLTKELQEIINYLYNAIDEDNLKDSVIQEQTRTIDTLRTSLHNKENELNSARQDVQKLIQQLNNVLKEKSDISKQLEDVTQEKNALENEIRRAMEQLEKSNDLDEKNDSCLKPNGQNQ